MSDWMRANPLTALLGLAGLVLLVAIGLEVAFGSNLKAALDAREGRRVVPAEAKLLPSLAAIGAEQAYPETVARPLFIPTRRPAPEAPVTAQGALQRGQYVLQGTIVVGENRIAMLKEKSSGKIVRVERGKDFNGMKVVAIEKEAVTLGVGNDEEKLVLNVIRPPAGVAAAAPSGPFPTASAPAPAAPLGGLPVPGQPQPRADKADKDNPQGMKGAVPQPTEMPPPAATPLTPEDVARRRAARRQQQQGN
jgi:hypothetical protein